MLLELVVQPAITAQVARTSRATLMIRAHVIEIALLGRTAARPEPAGAIPGDDKVGDPGRRPVRRRRQCVAASAGLLVGTLPLRGLYRRPLRRSQPSVNDLPER